jgi:2-hydroxy-6-oxonona-2,4-dienedioate hydrolase/4,5:9,10-diseco-3-hydroxy-5,9,17-trioxoandrosta-1(10),2-diene-4-oate hydrolase
MSSNLCEGKFVNANGVEIHYHEAGQGPAVLLLHGGGPGASGLSNYSRNMEFLSKGFRAIALDLPCYGKSTKLAIEGDLLTFYADCLNAALDRLGIDQADLVGNSLGGATSLRMALNYSNRVRKLVLMGPGGGYPLHTPVPTAGIKSLASFYDNPGMERLREFIDFLVYDPSEITDDLLQERLAQAMDPDTRKYFPIYRGPRPQSPTVDLWRERLDKLAQQTLIIWGREDRVNALEGGFILAKQIPNARLTILPKCGHWAQWEKADEFNRLVFDFLSH